QAGLKGPKAYPEKKARSAQLRRRLFPHHIARTTDDPGSGGGRRHVDINELVLLEGEESSCSGGRHGDIDELVQIEGCWIRLQAAG
ncbi:unnamed protein product, partial [Urochloa humidicola]